VTHAHQAILFAYFEDLLDSGDRVGYRTTRTDDFRIQNEDQSMPFSQASVGLTIFSMASDQTLFACELPYGNWVTDWPSVFPGPTPLVDFDAGIVDGGPKLVVIDANNNLWGIGLPTGKWDNNFFPAPNFTPVRFIGIADVYVAVLDSNGAAWVIGNPRTGGQWVQSSTIVPPTS
jgi:hypothetical protein